MTGNATLDITSSSTRFNGGFTRSTQVHLPDPGRATLHQDPRCDISLAASDPPRQKNHPVSASGPARLRSAGSVATGDRTTERITPLTL